MPATSVVTVATLTGNFEELIRARGQGWTPVYLDDVSQKRPPSGG